MKVRIAINLSKIWIGVKWVFLGGHLQNQVATKFFDAFVPKICRTPILFCKNLHFSGIGGGGGGGGVIGWEDPETLNFQ